MYTKTEDLIKTLRILVEDIQSDDGVANACIAEAADRLETHLMMIDTLAANSRRYSYLRDNVLWGLPSLEGSGVYAELIIEGLDKDKPWALSPVEQSALADKVIDEQIERESENDLEE